MNSHLLQKADLARMYRLFSRVPKGLEPVADIFKKHVEAEGMKLVKEATETSMAKTEKSTSTSLSCPFLSLSNYHWQMNKTCF